MTTITYYYKSTDSDFEKNKEHLAELGKELDFSVIDICLDDEPDLALRFDDNTPAIQIGPYRLKSPIDDKDVRIAIGALKDREAYNQATLGISSQNRKKSLKVTALERFSFWLSKNYVLFITAVLVFFMGIPFLAPVLLKFGEDLPAQVIYKVYSVFCHQLAYRSYFLFGEQIIYPREMANIPEVITYEQATGMSAFDTNYARTFEGNSILGYKVAICERDLAIYGSLALFGLFFQITDRKMKGLPWYFWVIFALIPIALDGGSQLFSLSAGWPAWVPIRESTPLLRTITGVLFGVGTGWYIFPMMEESMIETRSALARKLAIKRKLEKRETQS